MRPQRRRITTQEGDPQPGDEQSWLPTSSVSRPSFLTQARRRREREHQQDTSTIFIT
ncbi:MAG: hypothetical protein R3E12_14355 [Candidatus Eisenbacteria bacterium]